MTALHFRRRSVAARAHATRSTRETFRLRLESLESRTLLSASSLADEVIASPLSFEPLAGVSNTTPRGYTPAQISRAYGFDGITFQGGTVKGDGTGQTIAIVAAYDHPTIESDLAVFSAAFGLPNVPSFKKINQDGGANLPAVNAAWAQEIALDVEWAHAMAPGANILLVEAFTASAADLIAAVNTARNHPGVSVVSMSFGAGEFASQGSYDAYFTTPPGHEPVTFVAAAGDSGAKAIWPAISSNVIAVGGTTLSVSANGASETAWSRGGGGYSRYIAQPSYQQGVVAGGMRSSPDVSYVANPQTGVAIYNTVPQYGRTGWFQIGGTSAGAPQWAGLVAIVDQGRALGGQPLLGDGHQALYNLAGTSFRDVTAGSNGYAAGAGYDLVTGRGSPNAAAIVRELVATTVIAPPPPVAPPATPTPTPPAAPAPTPPAPSPAPAPAPTPPAEPRYTYQLVFFDNRWWIVRTAIVPQAADTAATLEGAIPAGDRMSNIATSIALAGTASSPGVHIVDTQRLEATARSNATAIDPVRTDGIVRPVGRGTGKIALASDKPEPSTIRSASDLKETIRLDGPPPPTQSEGLAVPIGPPPIGASSIESTLPTPEVSPAPLEGASVDACFADAPQMQPSEGSMVDWSAWLSQRLDVELAVLAVAVGIAAGTGWHSTPQFERQLLPHHRRLALNRAASG